MRRRYLLEAIKTIAITALCAVFSFALDSLGVRPENVMMIFIVGILVVIVETRMLAFGLASSVLSIGFFNFFLTEPRYTFIVDDPNYFITFLIFIVVTLITSSLTGRLQKQARIARTSAENARILYEIASGGFLISDRERLIRYSVEKLSSALNRDVFVLARKDTSFVRITSGSGEDAKNDPDEARAIEWCIENAETAGAGTDRFGSCAARYFPLKSKSPTIGAMGVSCAESALSENESLIAETISSQLGLALEQDELYRKNEQSMMEIEREKVRNALLRSISHDIRTPLTSISGSADFIIESFDKLDRKTILSLVADISAESTWLHGMVENLLHMTRIRDGKLLVSVSREIVDDLVEEAVAKTSRLLGSRKLSVLLPSRVVSVDVDPILIVQVLVNLLDNAGKYSREGSAVSLEVELSRGAVRFSVRDDGPGFRTEILSRLPDGHDDSEESGKSHDRKRGMGMGLSICRAIVQAHGGELEVHNDHRGGACVSFVIPSAFVSGEEGA
jgi:two-component system sensor histidine kinase KdpD